MTDTTPRAGAPLIAANQAQKNVTHNEALYQLDALIGARFLDRDLSVPPSSPADGDAYLVKATATGAWTGQDGKIAYCADGGWRFYAPFAGLIAYVADESDLIVFNGSTWVDYAALIALENVPALGVNTTADSTNKLAVRSNAALFTDVPTGSGGSGDIRVTLSKQAAANTASLLYQDNFSGRAEIGLCGDDNFHFKVSPDGSAWYDGFDISKSDGAVDFLASETALASAATTDLGTASSLKVQITGTTTITTFGTAANRLRFVRFAGALTLTHNATSLILLGGVSRTTATGDVGIYTSDSNGNWRERDYCRAASDPGDMATKSGTQTLTNKTLSSATLSGTTALPNGAITSTGGLLMGSASPTTTNVGGFGSTPNVQINEPDTTASFGMFRWSADPNAPRLFLGKSRGSTVGTQGVLAANDSLGEISFAGSDGSTLGEGARIAAVASGTPSSGNAPAQLNFMTSSGSSIVALRWSMASSGHFLPGSDNAYNIGSASLRCATLYAATGSINTSGEDTKANIRALADAEMAVANTLAGNARIFQFRDAIAKKGESAARLHAGMIYEDVVAAFTAQGLDPAHYGIVCSDPSASDSVEDGAGRPIVGLRYDELAQFVMAGLAARISKLEAR